MLELHGLWLLGALAVTYITGVFTSQWAKDKLSGIPGDLRSALTSLETSAKNELAAAKAKVVADTATLLTNAKAKVAADLAPAPAAPVVTELAGKPVVVTPVPTVADPSPSPLTPRA